jgi:tetratricopeptide (TPR) repeat protein
MASARLDRPLIGRLEAYQALVRRREAVLAGRGGVSFLEGPAGVGKSTFLEAVVGECRRQEFRVFAGRAEAPAAAPFQLVREPVRQAERDLARLATPGPEGLAFPYIPPLSGRNLPFLLGDVIEAPLAGLTSAERPPVLRAPGPGTTLEAERTRVLAELARPILAVAEQFPVLLALDDVNAADEGSQELLLYLASRIHRQRIWIVATTLPLEEVSPETRSWIEYLVREEKSDRFPVRALNEREAEEFVRWLDPARRLDRGTIQRWLAQTSGNPLFLEQILRARVPEVVVVGSEAPDALEYVQRRARSLPENDRRILTMAAVLGPDIRFGVLARSTDESEETLAETVERLVHDGLLRETGNEVFQFVREELRDELYQGLTETRRRILHRRAGEALEAAGSKDIESVYALARHFYLGRVDPKAVDYNWRAARYASEALLPGVALPHLERAREALRRSRPADAADEIEIGIAIARQLRRLGELTRAEQELRGILDRPAVLAGATARQRGYLPLELAQVRADQGRWEEARTLIQALLDQPEAMADPRLALASYRFAGDLAYFRGEYPSAVRYHEEARTLARNLSDEREVLLETVHGARAAAMLPGGPDAALPVLREAGAKLEAMGEKAEASEAHLYVGVTLGMMQDLKGALPEFEQALRLAEEAHDPRRAGWALFDIADTLHDLGRLDEAERSNRRAREILERVGDRFGRAQTYIYEGKIRRSRRDLDGAEKALSHALEEFRAQRMEADELEALLRLAQVDASRENWPAVRERIRELKRRELSARRPDLVPDVTELESLLPSAER